MFIVLTDFDNKQVLINVSTIKRVTDRADGGSYVHVGMHCVCNEVISAKDSVISIRVRLGALAVEGLGRPAGLPVSS